MSIRPDDLSTQIVTALLDKVPQLPREDIEDLIMGSGQPAGEAGFNIARVVAVLAGLERRAGRDRQPLLLVEPADDPHGRPRHQGR